MLVNGKVLTFFVFCIYMLLIIICQNYGQVLRYLRSNYFPCSCTCGNCSRDLLANISECYSFKELEGCCEALTSDIVLTELQEGHVLNCDNRDDNDDESRRRRIETTTTGSLSMHVAASALVIDVVHMVLRTSKQPICRLRVNVSIKIDVSHLCVHFIMSYNKICTKETYFLFFTESWTQIYPSS